jgi:predicted acyl esterase
VLFGTDWQTLPRTFAVRQERELQIPLSDGKRLVGNLFRPDTDDPAPVLLSIHPYHNGASGKSVGLRVEGQPAAVEVDGGLEVLVVAVATG